MNSIILNSIKSSILLKSLILEDDEIISSLEEITNRCILAFRNNNKVLFCGNGGSAADAQHLASELSGKFNKDRKPLYAEALHVNSSFMTATSNDYGFEYTYARMINACGKKGDILFALSTSGKSKNIINAIHEAKEKGMTTVGFTGSKVNDMDSICDLIIKIPNSNVPRIQESHMLLGHIICDLIEQEIFS
tara:strand:+ start:360 stop:935 length:576 start_codon:yes stop_codon:yes gene_type:complete